MGTGFKLPDVGEIQVLRDQKPVFPLCCPPYFRVRTAVQVLHLYGVDVMAKRRQQIDQGGQQVLIQLDLHATSGTAG